MASLGFFEALLGFFCFLIFYSFFVKKPVLIQKPFKNYLWNWPVLGMLPGMLVHLHYIYDFSVEVLENSNLTFLFKGPWFTGMDMLITVDPTDIHHITTSNFSNYNKGPEFQEVFDILGDGIFNSDLHLWKNLRISSKTMVNHQGFQRLSMSTTRSKIKNGLFPLFNHFALEGKIIDLQDVFHRFMLDTNFILLTGSDPRTLSIEMSKSDFAKAFDDAGEAIFYRHCSPRVLWKLQNWLRIGKEKKMIEASSTFDRVCAKCISAKRDEIQSSHKTDLDHSDGEDILTSYIKLDTTKYELLNPNDDKFLRDVIVNLMVAGKEGTGAALTWFFWLLAENPKVLSKILQEINMNLPESESDEDKFWVIDLIPPETSI